MSNDKEISGVFKRIGKWWIIIIGLILSTFALIYGGLKVEGFPTEQYTSVAAFIMLISTAILQNIDLDLQRKDLRLNRRALEDQREEMAKHTKEFQESNESNQESLELQKFFELLRLKEELYVEVVKEVGEKEKNKLQVFTFRNFHKFRYAALRRLYKDFHSEFKEEENWGDYREYRNVEVINVYARLSETDKLAFRKSVEQEVTELEITDRISQKSENSLIKLYTYHKLLKDMVSEGYPGIFNIHKVSQNIVSQVNKTMREIQYGSEKEPKTMRQIYDGVLTEDERLLYKILDRNLNVTDLFDIED